MSDILPVELLDNGPELVAGAICQAGDQETYIDGLVKRNQSVLAMQISDIAIALEQDPESRPTIHREAEGFLDGGMIGGHSIELTLPPGTHDRLALVQICEVGADDQGRLAMSEDQKNLLLRRAKAGYENAMQFEGVFNSWRVRDGHGSRMQRLFMKIGFGAVMWKLGTARVTDRIETADFAREIAAMQACAQSDWDKWAESLKL